MNSSGCEKLSSKFWNMLFGLAGLQCRTTWMRMVQRGSFNWSTTFIRGPGSHAAIAGMRSRESCWLGEVLTTALDARSSNLLFFEAERSLFTRIKTECNQDTVQVDGNKGMEERH